MEQSEITQEIISEIEKYLNENFWMDYVQENRYPARVLTKTNFLAMLNSIKLKVLNHKKTAPRESVKWFADQMERKLKANDHKGGWGKCDMQYLSMRLTQERKELYGALEKHASRTDFNTNSDDQKVIDECADIANFCLMIADKFGNNYGK